MEFYGAFSALPNGLQEEAIAIIKRIAVALHLIPKTRKHEVRCQVLTFDIKQGSYKILRGTGAETLPIFLLPIHSR